MYLIQRKVPELIMKISLMNRISKITLNHFSDCELWVLDLKSFSDLEIKNANLFLTVDERKRCDSFILPALKNRYLGSRILIKNLFATIFECSINDIEIGYSPTGKPYLNGRFSNFHFNYSDSQDLGIIAFSRSYHVGVDLEYFNKKPDVFDTLSIIATFSEKQWVLERDSYVRYYKLWTLKEAYLKCIGTGLLGPLPEMSDILNKPLGELYALPMDNTIFLYSDFRNDYMYSLVCRHAG